MLPSGLRIMEENAFENCSSVKEIIIPPALETWVPGMFSGTSPILWIHGPQNMLADALLRQGYDIDAQTTCRALIIDQTYPGTGLALDGPSNDADAYGSCLSHLPRMVYEIMKRENLTASEITSAITEAFSGALSFDISVLVYSGHGVAGGSLVGMDNNIVTPILLRQVMDTIPGRKVIIIDACYSGRIIDVMGTDQTVQAAGITGEEAAEFNNAFLSAFDSPGLRRGIDFSQYYIMTSSQAAETSMENVIISGGRSKTMGYFSYYLCRGCGWDGVTGSPTTPFADTDKDGVVSFAEAFLYAKRQAKMRNTYQDAQTNVQNGNTFSPFR